MTLKTSKKILINYQSGGIPLGGIPLSIINRAAFRWAAFRYQLFKKLTTTVHLHRVIIFALIILNCSLVIGCKVYSFTGTTLSPDLKTITIQNFVMNTAGGPSNLTLTFSEKLKEYYQRNTSLKLKPNDADLSLEGSITGYELTPVSATSSDKAALNRLTIRMEVRFVNTKDEDQSFEKEFSFYQDFPQEQTLAQVEGALVPKILDQLVLNIFNDTAAQW